MNGFSLARKVKRCYMLAGLTAAVIGAAVLPVQAQDQVEIRRLDIIIPFSAGGGTDTIIRQMGEMLRPRVAGQIAISNVPGDGGLLGLSRIAREQPDSPMIGMLNPPSTTLAQIARGEDAPVDIRELTAIAGYGRTFTVIATSADSPFDSFEELQEAYSSGEQLLLGGSDRGGAAELTAELLREGAEMPFAEYVAYDGSGASVAAIVRNEVPAGLVAHDAAVDGMAAGTMKPLLVLGGTERHPSLPDTPTSAELGYPTFEEVASAIRIVVGPPNMDESLRSDLVGLFRDVVTDPEVLEQMESAGIVLEYMSPEEVERAMDTQFNTLENSSELAALIARQ